MNRAFSRICCTGALLVAAAACSSAGGKGGSGGAVGTGGSPVGSGGVAGHGGRLGTGGAPAGTGGIDGGLGDGGVDGGSGGGLVKPTKIQGTNTYRFSFGDVVFEVDQKTGGRVKTLSVGATQMIVSSGTAADQTDWGSVFWTSPRTWKPKDWPPPTAYDNVSYTDNSSGDHLILDGPTDATMGIGFSKDYSVDGSSGWIIIKYTINSIKAVQLAPWEDTRVPRGGLMFFPITNTASLAKGPLTTMTTSNGIAWFDDAPKSASSPDGSKATADGAEGWEAYALGGVLFLKKFVDQPASAQVPASATPYPEGEIGIYPGTGFLEFEVEGPYTSIAAGGTLGWTVQWRVAKIPSSVTVSVGSSTLVAFARQQAAL